MYNVSPPYLLAQHVNLVAMLVVLKCRSGATLRHDLCFNALCTLARYYPKVDRSVNIMSTFVFVHSLAVSLIVFL